MSDNRTGVQFDAAFCRGMLRGMRMLWWGAVLLVGCGDPRAPFVGSYKGSTLWTYLDTGTEFSGEADFSIVAPEKSDRLEFTTSCRFTARAIDADTLQFDPISCPPKRGTSVGGAKATYTDSVTSGVATLTNKTITMRLKGDQLASDFSDGQRNDHFPFTLEVTATQQ